MSGSCGAPARPPRSRRSSRSLADRQADAGAAAGDGRDHGALDRRDRRSTSRGGRPGLARSGARTRRGVLHQRQHAQRAAAALLDLQRRADQHRAGRRQQVEVGEALQAVAPGAVHVVVARVRRAQVVALAGIGADRLGAEAEHVALLDQEAHRLAARPRRVLARSRRSSGRPRDRCALRPVGAHQHPGAVRDAAVRRLEALDVVDRQQVVGVGLRLLGAVDHAGRRDEVLHAGSCRPSCSAGRGRRSSGSARRSGCRCARRRRSCSSTSPGRARRSAETSSMRNGQHWPISGGSAICGNSGVSVCVRSTTRMRLEASASTSWPSREGAFAGRVALAFGAAAGRVDVVVEVMAAALPGSSAMLWVFRCASDYPGGAAKGVPIATVTCRFGLRWFVVMTRAAHEPHRRIERIDAFPRAPAANLSSTGNSP